LHTNEPVKRSEAPVITCCAVVGVIVICGGALVWAAVTSFITIEASKNAETVIEFLRFKPFLLPIEGSDVGVSLLSRSCHFFARSSLLL
jgi:hypothetical protein